MLLDIVLGTLLILSLLIAMAALTPPYYRHKPGDGVR
ncbi:hypothetical protein BJ971_002490 [Actinoplanes digitatis]|uniref:Uncharacterized protein n=1 Tax=Actinoplanes digitatis TaxID=1868 RepID=A0A7W7HW85_9ACTN|nr:hypothetical protein [Actinoplanes digitatis]